MATPINPVDPFPTDKSVDKALKPNDKPVSKEVKKAVDKSVERYSKIALDNRGKLRDAWSKFAKKFQVIENYQSQIEQSDRQIQRAELDLLLRSHVCEIVFVRRRPERAPERPEIRRMICTKSEFLLNSENGIKNLNYHRPRTGRRIDEVKHDIVVVWDIFMQDYRNVSMDTCYLRQTIPDDDTFWKYYNDALYRMTSMQKLNFMDSVG